MNPIASTVRRLLTTPHDARSALFVITFVALGRLIQEYAINPGYTGVAMANLIVSRLCFYTNLYFIILFTLWCCLPRHLKGLGNAASIGVLIGLLPPLIDPLLTPAGEPIRYDFMNHWEWSFYSPDHQPLGETITVWIGILSSGLFCGLVSRSIPRGILGATICYALLALVNIATSSLLTDHVAPLTDLRPWMMNIPMVLSAMVLWHIMRWKALVPRIRRMNHALPFIAIALLGAVWAGQPPLGLFVGPFLVALAFYTLLIHNDCYDREEDALAARTNPTSLNDVAWSSAFLGLLLFAGILHVMPTVVPIIVGIIAAGFIYHHPAVRLKQIFCMSYKVEGAWAALALTAGAAHAQFFAPEVPLYAVTLLIAGGGALFSMPKDWKDIESDRRSAIPTIYVQRIQAGSTAEAVHRGVCTAILAATLAPPVMLGLVYGFAPSLLLPILPGLLATGWLARVTDRYLAVEGFYWLLGGWLLTLAYTLHLHRDLIPHLQGG